MANSVYFFSRKKARRDGKNSGYFVKKSQNFANQTNSKENPK
jgi:hypothetical protein